MFAQDPVTGTSFSFSSEVPSPPERRGGERHIKILRVGILVFDGRRELCLIRNISAGGLMAHLYSNMHPGQRVTVELKTNQQVSGTVVWVREANAGIAFDTQVDIGELLANPPVLDNGWRARSPRVEVDRLAALRTGALSCWVTARDISQSGVKIETDQTLEVGADVVITLENFRAIAGVVRWQSGRTAGIAFNGLIPLRELIDWIKTSKKN
ncbi:MAG TPA: PilZ domain-containing protein [Burkholderiales bacterium]